jgi:RNA polymerase sigma-70 factor (ECF subfamily)
MDSAPTPSTDQAIAEVWRAHHRYLVNLAARTLNDRSAAEDVVQEAFGRLTTTTLGEIDDVRAWLTVIVRRLSLNRLRSAYSRREAAVGTSPPEAPGGVTDPADRITLDDQIRLALAVVLDRLTPAERTAFVLHDVFGYPFDAVGEIVGRTPTACRQLASRARRSVRAAPPAPAPASTPTPAATGAGGAEAELAERFVAACAGGDLTELMALLDPDVAGDATLLGGGLLNHQEGAESVATRLLALFGPATGRTLVPLPIERSAGVGVVDHRGLMAVFRLEAAPTGRVGHIHAYVRFLL